MRVVVTGGAGFIGANLCRHLAAHPDVGEVVAVDDLSSGTRANLQRVEAEAVVGSILDDAVLDAAVDGASSIVHLAARPSVPRSIADPVASHEVNATGTLRVLEAVRRHGVPHVVAASSSSVYGANPTLPKHEDLPLSPRSPYAASKLAAESYTLAWSQVWGFDALAFRLFNVFGPLQPAGHAYAAVIPAFVDAALAGRPVEVHGDGRQTRDFTFVDSVCEILTRAVIRRVRCDRPVNLAFGGRYDLLTVLDLLEGILGHPVTRRHVDPRPGDVRDSQADRSRLEGLFPGATPVPLEDGLRRTVEWFRGRGSC
ncbi:MAG TPA: NAD-dependent epimerase/dehydratase family protein [Acidimicrobiales bacterium]|jgi:UDP-glucose 4-epimerase|nr:NAD-dependent epimerase/dehydratase family protein [Acidimicrobiales bacterium]